MTESLQRVARVLQEQTSAEVRFDPVTRVLYRTDASIYSLEPLGVVLPRRREDLVAAVRLTAEHGLPVLPRGAGTGLAGQAIGTAVHLDCSKYLRRILEVNPEERWARVEPGLVLDDLNAYLEPFGLQFGPDVATSNRATLGGMIGNNSAGARSLLYGKTVDHVLSLNVVLAEGLEVTFGPLTSEELAAKCRLDTREGQLYRKIVRLVQEHREEILARYPQIQRRVSGYNLDQFVREQPFNLAKLIVGSEGTLGVVVEAKLNLVPRPAAKGLVIVNFASLLAALETVAAILTTGPAAVELLDRYILDLTRQSLEYGRRLRSFLTGDPDALLLVEYYGTSREEVAEKVGALEALRRSNSGIQRFTPVLEPSVQANVWQVRKAGVGLLFGLRRERKPISFVEDTAVPVERLPEFVRRFQEIVAAQGTEVAIYGHAGAGCLHLRPCLNLKEAEEVTRLRAIAEAVRDLVREFGGAMSGEHGDGLARSEWNEYLFGPRLYQAWREVKAAFDPEGRMNPGKIVEAPPMDANLRYGPHYCTSPPPYTYFRFAAEGGFASAVELCNGAGVCRKGNEGVMCPSFMATWEEEHSTRGRANALRAALSGTWPGGGLDDPRLYQVLELCLQCKGCKAECPSGVDLARLKEEFLAHYYERHGVPLRAWVFGHIATFNRLGCTFAPVSNWLRRTRLVKWLLYRLVGVHPRRTLPPFARPTFEAWFRRRAVSLPGPGRGKEGQVATPPQERAINSPTHQLTNSVTERRGQVVFFADTFLNYNYPAIGQAAVAVLEAAGYEVILPRRSCCGRSLISQGLLWAAKKQARRNLELLWPYLEQGLPVVGCEPSCLLTLRDDYPDLLADERAVRLAEHTFLLEEFLQREMERGLELPLREMPGRVLFHGHCHQKSLVGTAPTLAVLRAVPGLEVEEIDSGCCGMAGAFGYEAEHYELSLAIGRQRLFPAIEAAGEEVLIAVSGVSCRQQIEQGTGRQARHWVEILAQALSI